MNTAKNVLITIGVVVLVGFLAVLILGIGVISKVFLWLLGILAAIFIIGMVIFYTGKASGRLGDRKSGDRA